MGCQAILVCTTPFVTMAHTVLKSLGDGGAVMVVEIEHPLGGLKPEQVDARAQAAREQLDALLGSPDVPRAST